MYSTEYSDNSSSMTPWRVEIEDRTDYQVQSAACVNRAESQSAAGDKPNFRASINYSSSG